MISLITINRVLNRLLFPSYYHIILTLCSFKSHLQDEHRVEVKKAGNVMDVIAEAKRIVIDNEKYVPPMVDEDYETAVPVESDETDEEVMDIPSEDETPVVNGT